ncbi:MAG: hypothetical protein EXR62_17960 [Chloroflexi bacterium]|nr:hypothetical protein [Chloroflexota bacterium]
MGIIAYLTTGIDLLALAASLWLGCYIVTRNVRSHRGFTDKELELLEDLADQIASMIHASLLQAKNSEVISVSHGMAEVDYVSLVLQRKVE